MAIPESQLETWSHQGSVTQSKDTYKSIRTVLESDSTPFANRSFSIFLQGSYGNDTNVYAESDVDIVIELESTFQSGLGALPEDQRKRYRAAFDDATYTYKDFRADVLSVLRNAYGSNVKDGNKAIFIEGSGNRRNADVLVALQYRNYRYFWSPGDSAYVDGIVFYDKNGTPIVNYPKQHSTNLSAKHQQSRKWLKPTVRVFKNLRRKLVSDCVIDKGVAPSYFLEGLFYNFPNGKFGATYQETFSDALVWLSREADWDALLCANEEHKLFGDNPNTSWTKDNCAKFIDSAIDCWNNW